MTRHSGCEQLVYVNGARSHMAMASQPSQATGGCYPCHHITPPPTTSNHGWFAYLSMVYSPQKGSLLTMVAFTSLLSEMVIK